jgi:hypothetical protein
MDNKSKNNIVKKNKGKKGINANKGVFKKAFIRALLIALIPLVLAIFHFTHPYFYRFKWLKLIMYSVTFLLPIVIVALIELIGIVLGNFMIFALIYVFYVVLYYFIIQAYIKSKHKKRFILIIIGCIIIFVALTLYFMW